MWKSSWFPPNPNEISGHSLYVLIVNVYYGSNRED